MKFRIGSFNLKNMGMSSSKNFSKLADIIRDEKLDIVSLQEILSEGKSLKMFVDQFLPGWDFRWEEPRESYDHSKTKDKRGEGYAFIWNTRRVRLANTMSSDGMKDFEPRIINSKGNDISKDCMIFARTPFYARFIPVNSGFFEFRLINVHIYFGDDIKTEIEKRKVEYDFLINEVYSGISMNRRYGNNRVAYTIAMGDYNLNLYKFRGDADKLINPNTYIQEHFEINGQNIRTVQDELTSLKGKPQNGESSRGYKNNYDHFTINVTSLNNDGIKTSWKRIDAVRKYYNDDFDLYRSEISDHIPIVLEMNFNES